MKTRLGTALLLLAALWLGGCATMDPNVGLKPAFWENKQQTIVVSLAELPEANHRMLGQQGLLDIAINQGNAKPLIDHLKTFNVADYKKVAKDVSDTLTAQGYRVRENADVIKVATLPDFKAAEGQSKGGAVYASKDFTTLKDKLGPNRLLLITLQAIGTERTYYGFIPTGAPVAAINVRGEIIDLANNEVLWRQPFMRQLPVDGEWDQAPNFPNIDRALQKVMLMSRKDLQNTFLTPATASAK
jgi:hypothetical protein